MKIHEREQKVLVACAQVQRDYLLAVKDLTTAEELRVIATVFGDILGSIAKYAIRQERHGSTDKPGGVA